MESNHPSQWQQIYSLPRYHLRYICPCRTRLTASRNLFYTSRQANRCSLGTLISTTFGLLHGLKTDRKKPYDYPCAASSGQSMQILSLSTNYQPICLILLSGQCERFYHMVLLPYVGTLTAGFRASITNASTNRHALPFRATIHKQDRVTFLYL